MTKLQKSNIRNVLIKNHQQIIRNLLRKSDNSNKVKTKTALEQMFYVLSVQLNPHNNSNSHKVYG